MAGNKGAFLGDFTTDRALSGKLVNGWSVVKFLAWICGWGLSGPLTSQRRCCTKRGAMAIPVRPVLAMNSALALAAALKLASTGIGWPFAARQD